MAEQPHYGLAKPGSEPIFQCDSMAEAVKAKPMFRGVVIVRREGHRWMPIENPYMVSVNG